MNPELKNKLRPSIEAFWQIDQRISHQIKCVKLAPLIAVQDNRLMKQIIYNKFKSI